MFFQVFKKWDEGIPENLKTAFDVKDERSFGKRVFRNRLSNTSSYQFSFFSFLREQKTGCEYDTKRHIKCLYDSLVDPTIMTDPFILRREYKLIPVKVVFTFLFNQNIQ